MNEIVCIEVCRVFVLAILFIYMFRCKVIMYLLVCDLYVGFVGRLFVYI